MAKSSSMVQFKFQGIKFRNANNKRGKRLSHDERQALARSSALENNGEVDLMEMFFNQCGVTATYDSHPNQLAAWKNTFRREVECGFAKASKVKGLAVIQYVKALKQPVRFRSIHSKASCAASNEVAQDKGP